MATKYIPVIPAPRKSKYRPVTPAARPAAGKKKIYVPAPKVEQTARRESKWRDARPLADAMETLRAPIPGSPEWDEAEALKQINIIDGPESYRIAPGRAVARLPTPPGAVMFAAQFLSGLYLDVLDESGLKRIRADIRWVKGQEQRLKDMIDILMMEARERNLDLLFIVERPRSAVTDKYVHYTLQEVTEQYYDIANRYKPGGVLAQEREWGDDYGVRVWEIEGEANYPESPDWELSAFGKGYPRFFRACVEGIHAAYPEARIVLGSLWGRFCGDNDFESSPRNYLGWLLQDDYIRAKIDVVAVHPYRRPDSPEAAIPDQYEGDCYCTLEDELRATKDFVDARMQGRDLPIWITEIGWYTEGGAVPGEARNAATYMTRSFHTMIDLPFVQRVYWFDLIKAPNDPLNYHLFREDGSPTQAGEVVRWPPVHAGFPPYHTTGNTGLQRGNLTQRAYFIGRLSRGDEVTVHGRTQGTRPPSPPAMSYPLDRDYPTHVDVFGPTESERSEYHWDTIGVFGRTSSTATFTVRTTGTYSIALRPIPDWEPRYYDVRFSIGRARPRPRRFTATGGEP